MTFFLFCKGGAQMRRSFVKCEDRILEDNTNNFDNFIIVAVKAIYGN